MPPDDLSRLFNEAPCGFLSFADDGCVVRVNDTLLARLGYARADLVGQHVQTVLSLASRIFYQTHVFPLLRLQGRVDEIYLTLRARDGEAHAMFANGVRRIERDGPVNHCVLFPLDERRKYEEELLTAKRAAEEALAANVRLTRSLEQALDELRDAQHRLVEEQKMAGLGRMAAAVGHEIKNPLHFVINFGLLVGDLTEDVREHLGAAAGPGPADDGRPPPTALLDDLARNARRIVEHGRRADAVVRAMMDHARGPSSDRRAPADVNAVVREAVTRALDARSAAGAVDVEVACADDAGQVAGTAAELVRAVESLVANALDAVDAHAADADAAGSGEAPRVRVETRRAGSAVEIVVSDTGHGVAEADLTRIFEPFFTTRPPGTGHVGLGLSLAYSRVHLHGGALTAESGGPGATFTVSLPAVEAPPEG